MRKNCGSLPPVRFFNTGRFDPLYGRLNSGIIQVLLCGFDFEKQRMSGGRNRGTDRKRACAARGANDSPEPAPGTRPEPFTVNIVQAAC